MNTSFWLGKECPQTAELDWLYSTIKRALAKDEYMEAMLPERHDIEADGFITVYPKVSNGRPNA